MKLFIYSLVGVLMPFCLSFAYTSPLSPQPGSAGNPIYIQAEIVTTNEQKESILISNYGYSEYLSCRSSYCSGSTGGNPSLEAQCLTQVEAMFNSGICGSSQPNFSCQSGYSMVNGSCVRDVNQVLNCPFGSVLLNGTCVYNTQSTKQPSNDEICREEYGPYSMWTYQYNSEGGVVCGCIEGYDFSQGNSCVYTEGDSSDSVRELQNALDLLQGNMAELETQYSNQMQPIANKSNEEVCLDVYGNASIWTGEYGVDGSITCGCSGGYAFNSENMCVPSNDVCFDEYGINTVAREVEDSRVLKCDCAEGYAFGPDNKCDEEIVLESTSTEITMSETEDTDGNKNKTHLYVIFLVAGIIFAANSVRVFRNGKL